MEFDKVKDSGVREDMETGSRRDTQKGKSRPDLNNPLVIRRLGMHMANGCDKYGEHNYELGQPTSRYLASLERHLLDFKEGLDDEDHAAAIMWNIHGIIMNGEFVERGIYPPEMDDRTDYRNKEGFDKTVRKRAEEFNDKLRAAEDTISDVTYGTLEELDVPEDEYRHCDNCRHEDASAFVEPCKDCGEGDGNLSWHLWEPVPEPETKVWSREDSWDAEVDAKIKEAEAHIVEPVVESLGRLVPRHVECDCALEPALSNVPKESKLRCLAPAGCDASCVDDDHEGCDVKYICMADFEQCSNARREF